MLIKINISGSERLKASNNGKEKFKAKDGQAKPEALPECWVDATIYPRPVNNNPAAVAAALLPLPPTSTSRVPAPQPHAYKLFGRVVPPPTALTAPRHSTATTGTASTTSSTSTVSPQQSTSGNNLAKVLPSSSSSRPLPESPVLGCDEELDSQPCSPPPTPLLQSSPPPNFSDAGKEFILFYFIFCMC